MPASSDRNLLVALTALELACIDKEQLIVALQTWRNQTGTSLEDVLRELRYVDAITMHKLQAIVEQYSDSGNANTGSDPDLGSRNTPANEISTTRLHAKSSDTGAENSGLIEMEQPGANGWDDDGISLWS